MILGSFGSAEARFHLHPSVGLEQADSVALLRLPTGQRLRIQVEGGTLRVEATTWHPEFGSSEKTKCVVVPLGSGGIRTILDWSGND